MNKYPFIFIVHPCSLFPAILFGTWPYHPLILISWSPLTQFRSHLSFGPPLSLFHQLRLGCWLLHGSPLFVNCLTIAPGKSVSFLQNNGISTIFICCCCSFLLVLSTLSTILRNVFFAMVTESFSPQRLPPLVYNRGFQTSLKSSLKNGKNVKIKEKQIIST